MTARPTIPPLVSDIAPAVVRGRPERVARALRFLEAALEGGRGFASWTTESESFHVRKRAPCEHFSSMIVGQLLLDAGQESPTIAHAESLVEASCNPQGFLHFFADWSLLPADVDCTGVGHGLLVSAGRPHSDLGAVIERLLRNVESSGIIEIYEQPSGVHAGRLDAAALVNALYLVFWAGREAEARPSLDYVYEHLTSGAFEGGTRYYPSADTFLYFLSRLLRDFERAQGRLLEPLHEVLLARFGAPGCVLTRATRVAAADNVGLFDPDDLTWIADEQRPDGSWAPGVFFKYGRDTRYFGSEAVTTAFALRALVAGPKLHARRAWLAGAHEGGASASAVVTKSNERPRAARSRPA